MCVWVKKNQKLITDKVIRILLTHVSAPTDLDGGLGKA